MNRQDAKDAKAEPQESVDGLARVVIGAALEVHRQLGPGYLESVYEEAMAVELSLRDIEFERQKRIPVQYKGRPVGEGRIDLIVANQLIIELKAVGMLLPIHTAQIVSYLKVTSCQLGLLINFNERLLKNGIQRVVLTNQ
ncbi:MAG TPA: GxxExxY protein [Burkholderiales bacterium]|nr:GxxExxY protein [Burkholderiales bacterium]